MTGTKRATFSLLWQMVNEISKYGQENAGTIISRYASMLDDRIENSGHSRSTDSLKLYSVKQLLAELDSRKEQ